MTVRIVVGPEWSLDNLQVTSSTYPHILGKVDFEWRIASTSEEQVFGVNSLKDCRVFSKVNLNIVGSVLIVNNPFSHIPRSNVILFAKPLSTPPAGCDTNLIRVTRWLIAHVELLRFQLVPDLLREGGNTFVVAIVAVKRETIGTIPVDSTMTVRIVVSPDNSLYRLPVTLVGSGLVSQLGQCNPLSVEGMQITYEGTLVDVLQGHVEDEVGGTLTIEVLVVDHLGNGVGIKQLYSIDELEVGTIDRDLLAARGCLARLLGEARHYSMSYSQRKA